MKNLWKALLMVRRCSPRSFWLRVVYVLLQSVLPLVNLYILKLLVDAVTTSRSMDSALWMLLAMCGVFLLNRVVSALSAINNDYLSQRLIDYMSDVMQRQSAALDMAYYDTPSYHDTFHRAQQESTFRPMQILASFMTLGGAVVSMCGVMVMLCSASPWIIAVMVVAVSPSFAVRLYKARSIYAFRRNHTQLYRRTSYYGALLTGRDFAKEVRTYALAPLFRGRFLEARHTLVKRLLAISRRLGMLDVVCSVFEAGAMLGVVWMLLDRTFAGAVTIGSFVMLFEAFRRGQGYLTSLVGAVSSLYDNRLFVGNLFEFLELKPTVLNPANPQPMPERVEVVEFRDVTFRYPDMTSDVLSGFSLTARRGEVTRLDGRNGYGKSTLVKLLLRLYDPAQGAVMVDGVDIRRFDLKELRSRVGVLYQDFVRYYCTVADNVAFGKSGGGADLERALRLAGADEVVERLPQGVDTLLGRLFDGGSELSMGQWQRIALARAIASDAPVLVFDEPTAWLDSAARARFAEALRELSRDKVVILITHSQDF